MMMTRRYRVAWCLAMHALPFNNIKCLRKSWQEPEWVPLICCEICRVVISASSNFRCHYTIQWKLIVSSNLMELTKSKNEEILFGFIVSWVNHIPEVVN